MAPCDNIQLHVDARGIRSQTWTNEEHLNVRVLTWQGLLNYGRAFFNKFTNDPRAGKKEEVSSKNGNCLAATLCYTHANGNILFQCSIPRGKFYDDILREGRINAPQWWQASSLINRDGPPEKQLHAEDGAEYLFFTAQRQRRDTKAELPQQTKPLRLVVYGYYKDESPDERRLCLSDNVSNIINNTIVVSKTPSCKTVAEKLSIIFVPQGKTVKLLDKDERQLGQQQPPAAAQPNEELSIPDRSASQNEAREAEKSSRPSSRKSGGEFSDGGVDDKDFIQFGAGVERGELSTQLQQHGQRSSGNLTDQQTKAIDVRSAEKSSRPSSRKSGGEFSDGGVDDEDFIQFGAGVERGELPTQLQQRGQRPSGNLPAQQSEPIDARSAQKRPRQPSSTNSSNSGHSRPPSSTNSNSEHGRPPSRTSNASEFNTRSIDDDDFIQAAAGVARSGLPTQSQQGGQRPAGNHTGLHTQPRPQRQNPAVVPVSQLPKITGGGLPKPQATGARAGPVKPHATGVAGGPLVKPQATGAGAGAGPVKPQATGGGAGPVKPKVTTKQTTSQAPPKDSGQKPPSKKQAVGKTGK
jgi:hypothetical protein